MFNLIRTSRIFHSNSLIYSFETMASDYLLFILDIVIGRNIQWPVITYCLFLILLLVETYSGQ